MAKLKLYSKRNRPPATELTYDIDQTTRSRILLNFRREMYPPDVDSALLAVADLLECEYGAIRKKKLTSVVTLGKYQVLQAIHHFEECTNDEAIDFIQAFIFLVKLEFKPVAVNIANTLFEEQAIGFSFVLEPDAKNKYEPSVHAIRKTDELTHAEIVEPTLRLLAATPIWKQANKELLDAFVAHRESRFEDANTGAVRALETTLKTIFAEKKWKYDAKKESLAPMVKFAIDQGLVYDFYEGALMSSGTLGNKLGRHGAGPQPPYVNDQILVENLLHQVSAQILLLARRSGL